ncbi:PREDICTED: C-Myc-binding protein [Eurypyga helias]|uniref:C-Myc-binding protein n=1 Tax=Eurypyga helias TaxID=54383 RepID=UPI0005280A13|nr:PREDICTED: C-Myc-binding protein [Eurypyga helias]
MAKESSKQCGVLILFLTWVLSLKPTRWCSLDIWCWEKGIEVFMKAGDFCSYTCATVERGDVVVFGNSLSVRVTELSSCGVVLVALYEEPEKPNSALDFLKHHLGASAPENPEIEALRLEVAEMKEKYEAVLEENKKLKTKLAQYEPPQEEKHGE